MSGTRGWLAGGMLGPGAVLSHWLWALPVLLIMAALALRQIDAYPPAADEFFSLFNSGYLAARPYSPLEIVESLRRQSFDQMPGFFLLLGAWGNATSYTVPMARALPILIGILALAMTYRLAKDFVAPQAGLIALVIASSNAFYNFHYAFVRMYTLVVLLAALLLWLYFKIIHAKTQPLRRHFVALAASVAALMLTHPFCVTLLTSLGLYHLLFIRKDRRWMTVVLSVVVAVVVISPYLLIWASTLGAVFERKDLTGAPQMLDGPGVIAAWLGVVLDGQAALLVVSIAGIMLGIQSRTINLAPWLRLSLLFLGVLAAVAQVIPALSESTMRYHLVGWLPFVMLLAAALYCLYRFTPLLLCLALLWVAAGLWHQGEVNPDWKHRLGWQQHIYPLPPWHAVSREAQQAAPPPVIIAHVNMSFELRTTQHINYSQMEHYFDKHGIVFWQLDDLAWFDGLVNDLAIFTPNLWVHFQHSKIESARQVVDMREAMTARNYQLCDLSELPEGAVLLKYTWNTLDCQPPALKTSEQNRLIDYQFYGLDLDENAVRFIDSWSARADFDDAQYNLSYQLIDKDWNNAAQVDLPLVHEGKLRQFSIGASDLPAGAYRLMLILYNKQTGETLEWLDNPGFVPGMIELSEIVIQR